MGVIVKAPNVIDAGRPAGIDHGGVSPVMADTDVSQGLGERLCAFESRRRDGRFGARHRIGECSAQMNLGQESDRVKLAPVVCL